MGSSPMIKNHLHVAAYDGQEDVVKALLKQGSAKKQINGTDKSGWSPLHCAAARGHLKVSSSEGLPGAAYFFGGRCASC